MSARLNHSWRLHTPDHTDVCIACGLLRRRVADGFMEYFVRGKWMIVTPIFECSGVMGDIDP